MGETDVNQPQRDPLPEADVLEFLDRYSNAGRWGDDDELGTLNFIDPEVRLAAVATVRLGRVVSVARDLDTVRSETNPVPVVHRMLLTRQEGADSALDLVEIAPHVLAVTHLDAVAHMFADERVYNGRRAADVVRQDGLAFGSIHAQRDGIVTRGVLLDVAAAHGAPWLEPDVRIYPEDLDAAADFGGVHPERGDAVIVRTGSSARESQHGPADAGRHAGMMPECIGWLHEHDVALFSSDSGDFAPLPYTRVPGPFHQIALASLGMAFLDNPALDELSSVCAEVGRYEFLLVVAPLRLPRGTGSAVNPVCIF
jgi:kynurenine formamidase